MFIYLSNFLIIQFQVAGDSVKGHEGGRYAYVMYQTCSDVVRVCVIFLLYGQLFWAIKQSRGRINGVSYCWSGFGFQKWTNVRDFEDYSTWVSLVLRSEGLGGHLYADCDLLHWLPSNTRRGSLKIKLRRHKRPRAYYANSNATFHLILDVGDLVFKLNDCSFNWNGQEWTPAG